MRRVLLLQELLDGVRAAVADYMALAGLPAAATGLPPLQRAEELASRRGAVQACLRLAVDELKSLLTHGSIIADTGEGGVVALLAPCTARMLVPTSVLVRNSAA